jgi:ubiquinone/menaquinone biosynthesis C-methylase UbiE
VLDVGTGTGAIAVALVPAVGRVVGVDLVPELLAEARKRSPPEVVFLEADAARLPFAAASFDLVCSARTLHHMLRPEAALAEMTRVLRVGGTMLIVDELAEADPERASGRERFERARDPSTCHIHSDTELRGLFARNALSLTRAELVTETRQLDSYLDLAGCEGEARREAVALAPARLDTLVGWYVLEKREAGGCRRA